MSPARSIGICGAGTMGAGIAQLAVQSGATALLHDPDEGALARGLESARERLARKDADLERLQPAATIDALAGCDLVIEAAPESLELKRELLRAVAAVTGDACVLATNTSSLSVTAIAAGVPGPERVVGMHFFNPAPVMELVEVVAGERTGEAALALARATGEAMGRRVIDAADVTGFLVNRCNRPFALEALRVVQEGLATPEQVDRIARLGGGFRMGPFELMDLVGLDVGLEVSKSFWEQSFGEPRWRPSPLVARLVAAGRLGRKTQHGWYRYPEGRPADPELPERGGGDGLIVIAGRSELAEDLHDASHRAGWRTAAPDEAAGELPFLVIDCDGEDEDEEGDAPEPTLGSAAPELLLCDTAPLSGLDPDGGAAGFYAIPGARLVELTRTPATSDATAAAVERWVATLGRHAEWVGDAPGLVLGRIVCQLVNEACFALGEGVGSAADIDAGMTLGLNHPAGPLERGDRIGAIEVLAVVLGLQDEYREERYRPAPALVRAARAERPLRE